MFSLFHRGPARLTPQQAHRQSGDGQAVLLDVREPPKWRAGHPSGALHLPLSRLRTGRALPRAAQGGPVITICRSGNRSRQAVGILAARGVEATDAAGGMTARTRAGLPVTGDRGHSGGTA
ncbi:sulfurtransferase [Streptomyces fumigatiscleroticus]|nr:sulfurtransferase [Streptomyces fumigatiscleroticus]